MTLLPEWRGLRRLLVMRPDNIGDVVMASAALRAIRGAWPDAHVTLLASKAGAQVAPMLTWIDALTVARPVWQDIGGLPFDPAREQAWIAELATARHDAAILLTSFSQSPFAPAAYAALAGIPLRLGDSFEAEAGLLTHRPATPTRWAAHQAERNLRLLEAVGVEVADRALELALPGQARAAAQAWRAAHGVGDYLLLAPWASCTARTFPPDVAAAGAARIAAATGLRVIVSGGPNEQAAAEALAAAIGPAAVSAAGATDLAGYAALIAEARLVLAANSSALHIADAFRVPSVIAYSGTELEEQWRPRMAPHRLLRVPTPCSPCYLMECPIGLPCLAITPDMVAEAGLALLAG